MFNPQTAVLTCNLICNSCHAAEVLQKSKEKHPIFYLLSIWTVNHLKTISLFYTQLATEKCSHQNQSIAFNGVFVSVWNICVCLDHFSAFFCLLSRFFCFLVFPNICSVCSIFSAGLIWFSNYGLDVNKFNKLIYSYQLISWFEWIGCDKNKHTCLLHRCQQTKGQVFKK